MKASDALADYRRRFPYDRDVKDIINFVENNKIITSENLKGHLTASAFIVNPQMTKTLLVLHNKIKKWLQPGGHIEKGETLKEAAKREVEEELGLDVDIPDKLFDVDIHEIAEKSGVPKHIHYDCRFLVVLNEDELITLSDESDDYAWVPFTELEYYTREFSIHTMALKTLKHYKLL